MRWAIALLLLAALAVPARAMDSVVIHERDLSLRAALLRPQATQPVPAVVALHGCDGLGARGEPVAAQYRAWAEQLAQAGYAVLLPDSFGSRGAGSQCRTRDRRIRPRFERVRDANAARRWLQAQPWVRADRVFLMGWSHGATSTLWTVRPQVAMRRDDHDFRSAIAFYPACARLARSAWSARVPTLILVGGADDWTPARACQAMVDGARGRSAKVDIVVYPGAQHDFDHPALAAHVRSGLAFTPDGSGRAHVGSDPQARADAIKRVLEWLAR